MVSAKPTADKVIAAIIAGDFDPVECLNIATAVAVRRNEEAERWKWRVDLDGMTVDQATWTVGEAMEFEAHTGIAWRYANPSASLTQRVAVLAAHLTSVKGMKFEDAMKELEARPAGDFDDIVTEYALDDSPKDGGVPDT